MLVSAQDHSHCSNKIKVSKNTTAFRIKSYIPMEDMNLEKLRFTKINSSKFSQVILEWLKESVSLHYMLLPALMFSFLE